MTTRYVLHRLASALFVILAVLVLVFVVTHLLGDPVTIVLPSNASPQQVAAVRQQLHLNEPIWQQFLRFMKDALSGSFGDSYWQKRPAMGIVFERFPATAILAVASLAIAVPIGVGLGVLGGLRPGSVLDRVVNVVSFLSVSIVDFWLALTLILIFAVKLGWFPTSGYGDLPHLVLPAVTVAILQIGTLAQVTRSSVAVQMERNYVTAARAHGLSERRVVLNHGLRNAAVPVMTILGTDLAVLLNGTVIAEVVFAWPGVGLLLIQAIQQRDLPLIEACVFVAAVIVTLANLIVDLLYHFVNPQVRIS